MTMQDNLLSRSDDDSDSHGSISDTDDGNMFPEENTSFASKTAKRHIDDDDDDNENDEIVKKEDHQENLKKANNKKIKLKKATDSKKLNKPPTVEELNRLRETENLFHSNLFRRQIDEMLQELEVKSKHRVRIKTWVDKVRDVLATLENSEESYTLENREWLKAATIKFPLQFEKIAKGNYRFRKPGLVKLIGSHSNSTSIELSNVDVLIEIPKIFFDKNDDLNGKYFCKRALYLCQVANHLKTKADLVEEIKFACDDGDNWKPFLVITPSGKMNKDIKFIIHPIPEKTSFKLNRFIPERNNVRSKWFFGDDSKLKDDENSTPDYNAAILRDLRCEENEAFIENMLNGNVQLRNAVILLKVWTKQRELNTGFCSFTGHIISFIIAYLLHIRKLNTTMSSYQIIRTFWNYLVNSDWSRNGITLCNDTSTQHPTMSQFHDNFSLVFVDPSGYLNLSAGMSQQVWARCRDEAELALQCLDTPDINCFQILFMIPVPFSRLCDQMLVFHNWKALEKIVAENSSEKDKLNFCGMVYPQAQNLLISLLSMAFGKRVKRLLMKSSSRRTWALDKKPRVSSLLTFGIILDTEHCFSAIDKGPEADAKEAEEFRKFWKGRSELRRFKDGSITESVLWDAKSWKDKRMICKQVASYILKSKFELTDSDYHYVGDEVEAVLPTNRDISAENVNESYEKLMKNLRNLKDLPLDIISVQGSSSVFRSTEIFPPSIPSKPERKMGCKKPENGVNCCLVNPDAHVSPAWCASADVVLHLGSSNKWPRGLDAVRRIRAAFNIKISQLLTENYGYKTQTYPDWVDVLTESCVFRLRIVYPGEVALLKKTTAANGVVMYRDNDISLKLEQKYLHLPKLTSALSGLQSQHSSYGMACCLAKRWIRSHLINDWHISDEAIDLIMASIYVNPEPWKSPNQPQLAFLRFLALLAHTNWNIEFLLLNFNHVLSRDEKREIETHFDNARSTLPSIFIATPDDRTRSLWTINGPSSVVLLRLVNLAEKTLNVLESQFGTSLIPDIAMVFQPVLSVFDVQIQLVNGFVAKRYQSLDLNVKEKTLNNELGNDLIPIVNFDPVKFYLKALRDSYSDWAVFFYDTYGGSTIGVLWKPDCHAVKQLKVSHLYGRTLDKKTNTLHFNINSVLEGFYLLGGALIKAVLVKKDDAFVPAQI